MATPDESSNTVRSLRRHILTRWVGFGILVLTGWLLHSLWFGSIYMWPPMGVGKKTSFLLGCSSLHCLPLVLGFAVLYMVLFAVVIGVVLQTIHERYY